MGQPKSDKDKYLSFLSTKEIPKNSEKFHGLTGWEYTMSLKPTRWCYKIEPNSKSEDLKKLAEDLGKDRFTIDKDSDNTNNDSERGVEDKFRRLVETIEFLQYMYDEDDSDYINGHKYNNVTDMFHCYFEMAFLSVCETFYRSLFLENKIDIQYVSSSVANIRRLYPLDENDDFTQLLKNYIQKKDEYEKFISQGTKGNNENGEIFEPGDFIKKWIGEDGYKIGYDISIECDDEGLGVQIRLHQDENEKGSLLADSGYGLTQLFAILLNIEVAIMETRMNTNLERTIAIEEPEIHLHPSYQSKLADMFYEAYNDYGVHFIVETHSEYLIRKTQVMVAEKNYETKEELEEKCPFTTYYVPDQSTGRVPYSLEYRRDGKFKKRFDSGFYDEASNLVDEII